MAQKRDLNSFSQSILDLQQAAAHCELLVRTFSKLQRIGIFPLAEVTAERLDGILAELLANGLTWPTPTRKSQWQSFPYCQPIWREIKGGPPHLHVGWRHGLDAKAIPHPFGTAPWLTEWFASERRYAAAQRATAPALHPFPVAQTVPSATGISVQSAPPASLRHKSPPIAPKLATRTVPLARPKEASPPLIPAPPIFMTPEEVYERWRGRVAIETLSNWRSAGTGPPATCIGRAILYRFDLLEAWEQQQLSPKTKP